MFLTLLACLWPQITDVGTLPEQWEIEEMVTDLLHIPRKMKVLRVAVGAVFKVADVPRQEEMQPNSVPGLE